MAERRPTSTLTLRDSACGRTCEEQGMALELLVALAGDLLACEACALRSDAALWGLLRRALVCMRSCALYPP